MSSPLHAIPEARSIVAEHTDGYDGEVLLHLLVADLRHSTLAAWERGDGALTSRSLGFLGAALREGDSDVRNAVATSFVEDVGWWDEAVQPFLLTWPSALSQEVERQAPGVWVRARSPLPADSLRFT